MPSLYFERYFGELSGEISSRDVSSDFKFNFMMKKENEKIPRKTFSLKTGTEFWYQRWLWDGIYLGSQIPGIWDFFLPNNPEGKVPKNPKSPGLGFFLEQNPKILKNPENLLQK